MAGWSSRARRILEEAGMTVREGEARYRTLTGEAVRESRVTGYSRDGLLKISLSQREGEGYVRISVTARGVASRASLAESLEARGASVDFEEGERVHAVLKRVPPSDVDQVLRDILEA